MFCTHAAEESFFYPSVELFVPSPPPLFVVVSDPSLLLMLFDENNSSEETTNGFSTCFRSGTLLPASSMHFASTLSFSVRMSRSEASFSTASLSFIFSVAYRSNMLPSSSVSACFRSLERLADSLLDCFLLCRFNSRSSAVGVLFEVSIVAIGDTTVACAVLFLLVLLLLLMMVASGGVVVVVVVVVVVNEALLLFNLFLSLVMALLLLLLLLLLVVRGGCWFISVFIFDNFI